MFRQSVQIRFFCSPDLIPRIFSFYMIKKACPPKSPFKVTISKFDFFLFHTATDWSVGFFSNWFNHFWEYGILFLVLTSFEQMLRLPYIELFSHAPLKVGPAESYYFPSWYFHRRFSFKLSHSLLAVENLLENYSFLWQYHTTFLRASPSLCNAENFPSTGWQTNFFYASRHSSNLN